MYVQAAFWFRGAHRNLSRGESAVLSSQRDCANRSQLVIEHLFGAIRSGDAHPQSAWLSLALDAKREEGTTAALLDGPANKRKQRLIVVWSTSRVIGAPASTTVQARLASS